MYSVVKKIDFQIHLKFSFGLIYLYINVLNTFSEKTFPFYTINTLSISKNSKCLSKIMFLNKSIQ